MSKVRLELSQARFDELFGTESLYRAFKRTIALSDDEVPTLDVSQVRIESLDGDAPEIVPNRIEMLDDEVPELDLSAVTLEPVSENER